MAAQDGALVQTLRTCLTDAEDEVSGQAGKVLPDARPLAILNPDLELSNGLVVCVCLTLMSSRRCSTAYPTSFHQTPQGPEADFHLSGSPRSCRAPVVGEMEIEEKG